MSLRAERSNLPSHGLRLLRRCAPRNDCHRLALLAIVVLGAALLANSMTKEISRDEQMYCTAGVLLGQGHALYRDFSYPSQLPYHPLLLATLYRTLGTTHYLLVGRLVSVVCDILVVVFILLIYRSIFGPDLWGGLLIRLGRRHSLCLQPPGRLRRRVRVESRCRHLVRRRVSWAVRDDRFREEIASLAHRGYRGADDSGHFHARDHGPGRVAVPGGVLLPQEDLSGIESGRFCPSWGRRW